MPFVVRFRASFTQMFLACESDQCQGLVAVVLSCYGVVQSLSGDAERNVAVEAVGQGECSLYSEDTVTDEEGRFRLRGLLVSLLKQDKIRLDGLRIKLTHSTDHRPV